MSKPSLPDGLVAVVKRDCETCRTVVPVLRHLASNGPLTVYTQDDPAFPDDPSAIHDADLGVSWHHEIETVPTLIRVVDGAEVERTFGWSRPDWQKLTGIDGLGDELPVMRPGCGSMSVDPRSDRCLTGAPWRQHLALPPHRSCRGRRRHRDDVQSGVERRSAGGSAHRSAGARDARRDPPGRRRGRGHRPAGPDRCHR